MSSGWEAIGTHFNRKERVWDVETQPFLAKNHKTEQRSETMKILRKRKLKKPRQMAGKAIRKKKGPLIHLKIHVLTNTPKALLVGKLKTAAFSILYREGK